MKLLGDRLLLARLIFGADAVLGVGTIAAAALYGAALSTGSAKATFAGTFVPLAALWVLFCRLAYAGLTSERLALKILFWAHVVGHFFALPVGTLIAGTSVWIWRDLRNQRLASRHEVSSR
ncbi:MAG: hypothetical protein IPK07_24920 [Deltaproteobacteria bacterium]|nr:hypothetical protein [Deltaproteobacteria bacterium]